MGLELGIFGRDGVKHTGDTVILDGDLVVADVNDEESVRKSGHFLDATDGLVELFNVALFIS